MLEDRDAAHAFGAGPEHRKFFPLYQHNSSGAGALQHTLCRAFLACLHVP